MSMSLDGYIAGPDDRPDNPGGDGFMRLHDWFATADGESGRPPGPAGEVYDGMEATGAVLVGRRTAQRALEAGVLDELQVHQIPVLFGQGLRLFDVLPSRVELEIVRVIDTPEATHIRYRVRR
jgi:hypothetical protein